MINAKLLINNIEDAYEMAVKVIAAEEQFRGTAYKDSKGVWTFGYGETLKEDGKPVQEGDTISLEGATARLHDRVKGFLASVLKSCPNAHKRLSWEIAAMVSLAYNIGEEGFRTSNVCRKVQADDPTAGDSFFLWNKETINGVKVKNQGLQNRRTREYNLFKTGRYNYGTANF